jgi:hypothetical protein
MAERGLETLRHGPMKPFGLTNPHQPGGKPYAVVQLRQDNKLGTLFNMVGFQTKLKHGEQVRVFRTIPGLQNAEFARLGGLHRNTFLNSPKLLDDTLRFKAKPQWRFAGQITGCEGYVESAAVGLLAGRFAAAERRGERIVPPPATTAHGALLAHITGGHIETIDAGPSSFQPMNVNFGLFPPCMKLRPRPQQQTNAALPKRSRADALIRRALADLDSWIADAGGGSRIISRADARKEFWPLARCAIFAPQCYLRGPNDHSPTLHIEQPLPDGANDRNAGFVLEFKFCSPTCADAGAAQARSASTARTSGSRARETSSASAR